MCGKMWQITNTEKTNPCIADGPRLFAGACNGLPYIWFSSIKSWTCPNILIVHAENLRYSWAENDQPPNKQSLEIGRLRIETRWGWLDILIPRGSCHGESKGFSQRMSAIPKLWRREDGQPWHVDNFSVIFLKKKSIVPFSWTKPQNIGTSPKASQHLPFHEGTIGFLSWAWTKEPQGRLLQQPIQPQVIEKLGVWRWLLFKEHHPHVYIYTHNYINNINIYIITKLCIHYVCIYGNGISKYLLRWISIVRLNMLFASFCWRDFPWSQCNVCCSATLWFSNFFSHWLPWSNLLGPAGLHIPNRDISKYKSQQLHKPY